MKKSVISRILATLLVAVLLVGALPMSVFAATAAGGYNDANGGSDYYNVISEKEWDIAPGVKETELVLNNDEGTRRQVLHTAIVDLNNPFVKVIPGTKGMWPEEGNYGTQSTSVQALEAEKLGYGNVVVATNASLSWYTEAYYKENPHLIGEPLGYSILDGKLYANSRWVEGVNSGGVATITVINYDYHPITGEKRPDDMPKVWIRNATDPLTGWEEQAIPVLFTYLVKPDANGNPVNQYKEDHGSGIASRTFVGVRADGTLVLAVSDGEQAPYSTGFTSYEMAEYMIKMGCVIAANCDGGGSTTFCSQRPGEDLKVNCSLSDGGERPTSNTFLVVSTAPADGQFARATLSTEYDYYTPGSSVKFDALGTDAVGTKVDIPEDVEWQIKESGMGSIANGVFRSNGTEGTVTVQMVYSGNVVGEKTVTVVTPDAIYFEQPIVTIPFGKTAKIPVIATANIDGVDFEIGVGENDVSFTTTNSALGYFEGLSFVAVSEADAPADITSTVTATLNMGENPTATVQLNLGKASEVLWDFEDGQADIDEWNVINNRKNAAHWDYYLNLSLADKTNGQVHDGNYSMRLETNGLSSKDSHSEQYAWIRLGVDGDAIVLENAKRVGFWLYVPEDNIQCWVQWHYKTDSDGDGVFDTDNVVSVMESENVYYNIDESGWHYLSMDVSKFSEISLQADKQYDKDPADGMTGETGEFFLALVFHKAINNKLWQENGSINGNYTYYIDNFIVDYSEAVDDRENPIFDKIYLDGTTALVKRDVITTTSNVLNLSAAVKDKDFLIDADKNTYTIYNVSGLNPDTAKVYIDGVEVESTFAGGVLSANGIVVPDGYHRVKFEISDKVGNKSVVIRVIKVESGVEDSTLKLVPADATLDRIPFGSIYWMNLEANAIETIQSVKAVIDLNNVNHWQLDNMELAYGFTAEYTINAETNTATITITRTGDNDETGAAVLAKLPVRILYFDTDIKTPGYTAETYWTTYSFWAQDMKMDVDLGLITHVDGSTSTFSNEEFHVDTEMYTSMANMDKEYFAAHGTTHVHTPVALEDKAPTCTENGYTGRTFCYGCNSPVEWGTTVLATGHNHEVSGNKLVCDCGHESKATGLQTIDGVNYYAVGGTLQSGWIGLGDDWYYFDKTTFAGVDGEQYADNGVKFSFDNGLLLDGAWVRNGTGLRYWYGPGYYKDTSAESRSCRPYEINGKLYLFNRQGYMQTGVVFYCHTFSGTSAEIYYYDCGIDGVASLLNGLYNGYFYNDGEKMLAYQLVQDADGDYYFVNDGHKVAMNTTIYLADRFVAGHTYADGTAMKAGYYTFDAE
ncbi:MAG: phosphodiester glycosidase family protein, partial [Clostridia bacterium]|nr:phosphodiester glycosidase family protein [Clostridia bacterium]